MLKTKNKQESVPPAWWLPLGVSTGEEVGIQGPMFGGGGIPPDILPPPPPMLRNFVLL